MPREDKVVAVVLASGASSRMGQPKALLDFDGESCLALVLAACRDAGASAAVVVTAPDGAAVREHLAGLDPRFPVNSVVNPHPERGMLSSLQTGARHLPSHAAGFLMFPVDYPLVRAGDVAPLVAAFAARTSAQHIFVPSFANRRGHPVLFEATLVPELLALGADASARSLLAAHELEVVHLAAASDRVLVDMDTPADYALCRERHKQP